MRTDVKDPRLGQRSRGAKDRENIRHQELMTTFQGCSSASSCCFEADLWLSSVPRGQTGRNLHRDCSANTTRAMQASWVMEGVRSIIFQGQCARGSQTQEWC